MLRDDNTEVEIKENIDYGPNDFGMMDDSGRHYTDDELARSGFTQQEVKDGEFANVDTEADSKNADGDDFDDDFDDFDDDASDGFDGGSDDDFDDFDNLDE